MSAFIKIYQIIMSESYNATCQLSVFTRYQLEAAFRIIQYAQIIYDEMSIFGLSKRASIHTRPLDLSNGV